MSVEILDLLTDGTVTDIKVGGVAVADSVVTQDYINTNLGNVDNTADADKPVSTDQQTALDLKRDITNLEFGTATDNTTIEADGHITYNGDATVWEDVNMDPTMLTGKGTLPSSVDFASTGIAISSFVAGATNEVEGVREYPHSGKLNNPGETSVIMGFHVHTYAQDTAGGNVRLELEYFFSEEGVAVTTSTTIYLTAAVSTTAWAKTTMAFADIPVPENIGAQFHFRFARLGGDALDTYTGDLAVSTIGFHVEKDSGGGSRQITTK